MHRFNSGDTILNSLIKYCVPRFTYANTESKNKTKTNHDGIVEIKKSEVFEYVEKYNPKILRWNIKTDTMGFSADNIGITKGRTFDRVLIFPTRPMKEYLKTNDLKKAGDLSKLYVAVTRARFSVAFVVD